MQHTPANLKKYRVGQISADLVWSDVSHLSFVTDCLFYKTLGDASVVERDIERPPTVFRFMDSEGVVREKEIRRRTPKIEDRGLEWVNETAQINAYHYQLERQYRNRLECEIVGLRTAYAQLADEFSKMELECPALPSSFDATQRLMARLAILSLSAILISLLVRCQVSCMFGGHILAHLTVPFILVKLVHLVCLKVM